MTQTEAENKAKVVVAMRQAFIAADKDGNGVLNGEEIRAFFSTAEHGLSDYELDIITEFTDKNGDGVISMAEFEEYMGV